MPQPALPQPSAAPLPSHPQARTRALTGATHKVPDSVPGVVGEGESQSELSRVDESGPQAERLHHGQVVGKLLGEQQGSQAEEGDS